VPPTKAGHRVSPWAIGLASWGWVCRAVRGGLEEASGKRMDKRKQNKPILRGMILPVFAPPPKASSRHGDASCLPGLSLCLWQTGNGAVVQRQTSCMYSCEVVDRVSRYVVPYTTVWSLGGFFDPPACCQEVFASYVTELSTTLGYYYLQCFTAFVLLATLPFNMLPSIHIVHIMRYGTIPKE
jgi:hypothetical protein